MEGLTETFNEEEEAFADFGYTKQEFDSESDRDIVNIEDDSK